MAFQELFFAQSLVKAMSLLKLNIFVNSAELARMQCVKCKLHDLPFLFGNFKVGIIVQWEEFNPG